MHIEDLPDVLTAEMISKYLSLSKRRIYELMEETLPCIKIGRSKRVLKADLIEWLESMKEGQAIDLDLAMERRKTND
jgi:excisionase family DNA binding protein